MQRVSLVGLCFAAMIAPDSIAYAQGVQTGTVTGIVESLDGVALPGVAVTAASAALQGERTTLTDVNGVYSLRALPAGTYAISFAISDFQPSTRDSVDVNVGALNNQKQIGWDRTVSVAPSSPLDANGIRTGYIEGPRYGLATNDNQFPQPYPGQNGGRAFRAAFGVRF